MTLSTETLLKPRGLVLFLAAYLGIHLLVRLLGSNTFQVDDAEQIVLGQDFALGYNFQPPLYTWLSIGMFKLFGTGLAALTVLKYLLLALLFWLTWLTAGLLFEDGRLRALATLAWLLVFHFAWGAHQGFTHTILLSVACMGTFYAVLRIHRGGATGDFLLLGAAVGAGLMAKYSFLVFLLALLAATVLTPAFRRAVLGTPRIAWAVGVTLLITAPHLFWTLDNADLVLDYLDRRSVLPQTEPGLLDRARGWLELTAQMVAFVSPLWLAYLLCLPGSLRAARAPGIYADPRARLLLWFHLGILLLAMVLTFFMPMPHYKSRWLHPFMLLFPVLWLTWAGATELRPARLRWLVGVTAGFALLVLAARVAQVTVGPMLGRYSRVNIPVVQTVASIPVREFSGTAIVATNNFVGAHAYLQHPDSPVQTLQIRYFQPQAAHGKKRWLFVWETGRDGAAMPASLRDYGIERLGLDPAHLGPRYTVTTPYPGSELKYSLSYAAWLVDRTEGKEQPESR